MKARVWEMLSSPTSRLVMPFFIFAVSLPSVPIRFDHTNFVCNVGAFEDDDVTHVEGEVNPVRDIEIINEELRLKDEEQLMAAIDKLGKTVLRGEKKDKPEYVSDKLNYSIKKP